MSPWRRSTPEPARLRAAQANAASSSSTACTAEPLTSVATARGDRTGPGAQVHDPCLLRLGGVLDRPAREHLGLGPGTKTPGPTSSSTCRKRGATSEVLQGLAGGAAFDEPASCSACGRS